VRAGFGWTLIENLDAQTVALTASVFAVVMSVAMTASDLYHRSVQEQEAVFPVRVGSAFLLGAADEGVMAYG
jgi:hypothetical protein